MKNSGLAATLGVTALAGCSGFLGGGGGSGASNWQYDPATLAETQARFFGSMEYGELYSMRDQLPASMQSNFETSTNDSPISQEDIDVMTGVGGGQVSLQTGGGAFFGSAAVTGSFEKSTLTEQMGSQSNTEQSGEYEGYTLYSGTDLNQQMPGSTMPGQSMDATATVAAGDGALVVGATAAQGSELSVSGQESVETMIDAEAGNAELLRDNSEHASELHNQLGGSMMVIGGEVDSSLVETYRNSGGGMYAQLMNGLRAGGFNMDIGSSTTTMKVAIVYNNGTNAEESGITQYVDLMKQSMQQQEAQQQSPINSINSNRSGGTITVTIEGDTEELLAQGQQQVPMGGGMGAVPVDN